MYDVRRTLDKLLKSPENCLATHVMYDYFFGDPKFGRIVLGLEMIKVINDQDITDCMLMLTRQYGPNFHHIRNRKFTEQVCKAALTEL